MFNFFYGLMLGLGAAMPIGPICIEMMRRNLIFGMLPGIGFGGGACCADMVYLNLAALGFGALFQIHWLAISIQLIGSALLMWFAWQAFKMPPEILAVSAVHSSFSKKKHSFVKHLFQGFGLTLLNPFTIVFWASVSSHIANTYKNTWGPILVVCFGVFMGAFLCILGYNSFLGIWRHRISIRTAKILNSLGGSVLLAFAIIGLFYVPH